MRYEYEVGLVEHQADPKVTRGRRDEILNAMGSEGWMLTAVVGGRYLDELYFMRPVDED